MFCCVFFFNLVCDPKLILQISGTFQQSCRKLHRKTEEADNALKVVLPKLSSCCDELGKMDLDDSTIENMCSDIAESMEVVERYEVDISAYQLTFLLPARICCCCILVLGIY